MYIYIGGEKYMNSRGSVTLARALNVRIRDIFLFVVHETILHGANAKVKKVNLLAMSN